MGCAIALALGLNAGCAWFLGRPSNLEDRGGRLRARLGAWWRAFLCRLVDWRVWPILARAWLLSHLEPISECRPSLGELRLDRGARVQFGDARDDRRNCFRLAKLAEQIDLVAKLGFIVIWQ